jgi:hypothetical protein
MSNKNAFGCLVARCHAKVASEPWLLGNETEIRFSRTRLISQGINMPIMVSANNYHVLRHISIFQSRFRTYDKINYCMDDSSKINIILIFVFFYFNISCSVLISQNSTTVKENWVVAFIYFHNSFANISQEEMAHKQQKFSLTQALACLL